MAERELDLRKTPERTSAPTPNLAERLVNTYLGKRRIDDAIGVLKSSYLSINTEGAVEIAQTMASVDISPAPILKLLRPLRRTERDSATWSMAKVYALMGDYKAVEKIIPKSIFPTDNLFFTAKAQMAKGEDPTIMLKAAEVTTQSYDVKNPETSYTHRETDYERMGVLYAQAGLTEEARRTFDIAEGIIDRSRAQYNEGYAFAKRIEKNDWDAERLGYDASDLRGHHDSSYHLLACTYAEAGWFEDALRIAGKLKEDKSHYFSSVIESISRHQLERGLTDDAVETAGKLKGQLYVKTLAQKAAIDAAQGKPYQETIKAVEKIIENKENDKEYVQWRAEQAKLAVEGGNIFAAAAHIALAYPLGSEDFVFVQSQLGVAAAKGGDLEATKTHFDKAWEVVRQNVKEEDDWSFELFKSSMILDLAKAVDDGGFDASGLFGQAMAASKAIPEGLDVFDEKWRSWSEAVTESCKRGYLDLAREAITAYNDGIGPIGVEGAHLLARLGATEIRNGVPLNQLDQIPLGEIEAIMASGHKTARQAVIYFGLDKKVA